MTSYFSSMWEKTVGTSAPSTPAPVVAPENDAAVEEGALRTTLAALRADLDNAVTGYALPELDPWRTLLAQPDSRSEIVLRVLRYQTLNVTKAVAQVRAIIAWRAERRVCEIPATAMIGPAAGLPCLMVPAVGAGRRTLIFVKASAYVKKDVTLAGFETGLIRFFETLLYTADGMRANGSVVVVDFCDLSVREVDLAVTKRGIEIFLRYYPETFAKMLFVNFPRFIFHFWKMISPLLDARTKERIIWCDTYQVVNTELGRLFDRQQLPVWLGGACDKTKPELLIGQTLDETELVKLYK